MADEVESIEINSTPSDSAEPKEESEAILEQPKQVESEPVSAVSIPETPIEQTAQLGGNEPLATVAVQVPTNPILALLTKARVVIQGRKRKKLDKIMSLLEKQQSITNDQVEKFLHISDATATRYLSILEKEGRIKQTGKTGRGVLYSKI